MTRFVIIVSVVIMRRIDTGSFLSDVIRLGRSKSVNFKLIFGSFIDYIFTILLPL